MSWCATTAAASCLSSDPDCFPLGAPGLVTTASALVPALVTGFGLGSMYGLTALGFYVTYASSRTVNFAQGSTLMLGAVVTFVLQARLGWPWLIAIPLALTVCAVWSVLVERIAVRPFASKNSDSWLMATVALGLILENVVLFTFGKDPRGLNSAWSTVGLELAGLRVSALQIMIPVVGFAIAGLLQLLTRRTAYGRKLLAVAQNNDAAKLMGINPARVISGTFALAGIFAGVAGIMIAPLYTVSAGMGTLFGIKAFAAAILGGIGSAWGVMGGGLLLGVIEACIIALLGSTYAQMLSFLIVILVLAWRPVGLFGRAPIHKV
jgi:branched-chain amino acid transport system permease protein